MTAVLDASAILAWLQDEPGANVVDEYLYDGIVSSVNWAEVLQKAAQHGRDAEETGRLLGALGLVIVDATMPDAESAARLWDRERPLSLADRFCLALAARTAAVAVTAERAWAELDRRIDVKIIR